jgi:hypothetical protein
MAMDPTALKPVRNLPASTHLRAARGTGGRKGSTAALGGALCGAAGRWCRAAAPPRPGTVKAGRAGHRARTPSLPAGPHPVARLPP